MPLKIIIVGGGIGGLALAAFLRPHGHQVTILERSQLRSGEVDYGLSVVSNAFGLLQKLGVDAKRLEAITMTHFWIRDHENKELQTTDFRAKGGSAPSVLCYRSTLQLELLRLATSKDLPGQPAEIVRGVKIRDVDVHTGDVRMYDHPRVFQGNLVMGADGINSTVRAAIAKKFHSEWKPVTHDLLAFTVQLPVHLFKERKELGGLGFDYLGDPEKQAGLVLFSPAKGADPKKRILLYHVSKHMVQVVGYTTEKEFAQQFDSKNTTIVKDVPIDRVVQEFKDDFSPNICKLFKISPHEGATHIDAWQIRDLEPLPRWGISRAIVIGDAAHAVTPHAGQGCNITIEDAEALAFLLKDASNDQGLSELRQRFEDVRKKRAEYVARRSRQIGNVASKEDWDKGAISEQEFAKEIYGYKGVEQFIKDRASAMAAAEAAEND
jgi:salicylate hydroxylase